MTILSAAQDAAVELNQPEPASLFGSSDTFARELRLQAARTAEAVMKAHDWQALTVLATLTGDGSVTTFSLPSDYDRMPTVAKLHSSSFQTATFTPARDLDHWLYLNDTRISGTPGNWVILGGFMQIFPAVGAGDTARFYYISKNYALDADATTTKPAFTADTDTFRLSERVLALGMVWRWRASKRMEYAEDLRNFELALADEVIADKGSRTISIGRRRLPFDVDIAYPGVLGP